MKYILSTNKILYVPPLNMTPGNIYLLLHPRFGSYNPDLNDNVQKANPPGKKAARNKRTARNMPTLWRNPTSNKLFRGVSSSDTKLRKVYLTSQSLYIGSISWDGFIDIHPCINNAWINDVMMHFLWAIPKTCKENRLT